MSAAVLVLLSIEVHVILQLPARLSKRLQVLNLSPAASLPLAHDLLHILNHANTETAALLRPYRRLRKWLTHPLAVALFASYRHRAAQRWSASRVR